MRPLVLVPLVVLAAPAWAQDASPVESAPADAPDDEVLIDSETGEEIRAIGDEILVVATRIKGQVEAPQAPLLVLDEADISSYGSASLSELLDQLSPQTGSGRGRGSGGPVVLLNGRRISGFREIQDLPPEAIRRMEILPEEVALRYGYPANQRVVNFILKDNFASKTVAVEYEPSTHGGTADSELEAGTAVIAGQKRFHLHGRINDTTMLTEAERDVIQTSGNLPTVAGDPDPAAFRSLVGASRKYGLNGTWSTAFGEGPKASAFTINGALTRTDSRSLNGLDTIELVGPGGAAELRSLPDALERRSHATAFQSGLVFNKPLGGFNLTATADGGYTDTRSTIDQPRSAAALSPLVSAALAGNLAIDGPLPTVAPGQTDRARSQDYSLTSLATLSGTPFRLPAGEASLTVKGGFSYTRTDSNDTRTARDTSFDRSNASTGLNLGVPLTSRKNGVLGAVGDLSLNLSLGLSHLSDFGTLKDWSAGLTWAPTEKLNFQASYLVDEAAPSLSQLGSPTVLSSNVVVYDFTRGETALVTVLTGGNPDLVREKQRDWKFSGNWQLPFLKNSNLIVEYFRNRSTDVTQDFPLLTPAIEAAFPGRVVRDGAGQLVAIDRRPVTFSEVKSSRIRWGFNISGTIGKPQPQGRQGMMGMMGPCGPRGPGAGAPGGARPGGMGGGGMGRGPGGGGRGFGPGGPGAQPGNGQGRWNLSLFHKVELTNTVLVAPGGPVLDLLDGSALTAGGVARHGIELEGGLFHKGFGLRANGDWSSPVTVRATGAPGSSDLRFGSVFKLNLRAFVNFDQRKKLIEDVPFLKGTRLSLTVDNMFDSRQRVTDQTGAVPLSYQLDYRDPKGRVVGIDFRKMF
ncbi:TonB-dependent receptor [Novosphingobium sp. JCM 18896]|uniref:TonB-dependent receptor n=1 Tax=Novosphingobium sp. JCM 18896 TaxID=2989731 RepID=UPI002222FE2D|nr:TonB-dependent receptor [Novosphingobium sp. JCM 18896]MCW1427843.1 TonB-dependent receptor [Novosphingobium sp. JCM 18896]